MSINMQSRKGDLLAIKNGILVHGCNCHGVMGAGVAAAVRRTYPSVFDAYARQHKTSGLRLGTAQVCYSTLDTGADWTRRHGDAACADLPQGLVVVNAMTQFDFGTHQRQVDYDAVSAAFARIRLLARDSGLPVYFPLIGCGLAGGVWEEVEPLIIDALGLGVEATLITL